MSHGYDCGATTFYIPTQGVTVIPGCGIELGRSGHLGRPAPCAGQDASDSCAEVRRDDEDDGSVALVDRAVSSRWFRAFQRERRGG
jgi:hypothetical protein